MAEGFLFVAGRLRRSGGGRTALAIGVAIYLPSSPRRKDEVHPLRIGSGGVRCFGRNELPGRNDVARATSAALHFRAPSGGAIRTRRASDAWGPFCGPEAPRSQGAGDTNPEGERCLGTVRRAGAPRSNSSISSISPGGCVENIFLRHWRLAGRHFIGRLIFKVLRSRQELLLRCSAP
jgi:hypothetical protein